MRRLKLQRNRSRIRSPGSSLTSTLASLCSNLFLLVVCPEVHLLLEQNHGTGLFSGNGSSFHGVQALGFNWPTFSLFGAFDTKKSEKQGGVTSKSGNKIGKTSKTTGKSTSPRSYNGHHHRHHHHKSGRPAHNKERILTTEVELQKSKREGPLGGDNVNSSGRSASSEDDDGLSTAKSSSSVTSTITASDTGEVSDPELPNQNADSAGDVANKNIVPAAFRTGEGDDAEATRSATTGADAAAKPRTIPETINLSATSSSSRATKIGGQRGATTTTGTSSKLAAGMTSTSEVEDEGQSKVVGFSHLLPDEMQEKIKTTVCADTCKITEHLDGESDPAYCAVNECECEHGEVADICVGVGGTQCKDGVADICVGVGGTQCKDGVGDIELCKPGYHYTDEGGTFQKCGDLEIKNGICAANTCSCVNGKGMLGEHCLEQDSPHCASCNDGFHLNEATEKPTCDANVCVCHNGDPAIGVPSCRNAGDEACSRCKDGFTLNNDTFFCEPNVCRCTGGKKVDNKDCPRNGMQKCRACDDGYKLQENGTCRANTCLCEHGIPSSGVTCRVDGIESCDAINPGYHPEPVDFAKQLIKEESGSKETSDGGLQDSSGSEETTTTNNEEESEDPEAASDGSDETPRGNTSDEEQKDGDSDDSDDSSDHTQVVQFFQVTGPQRKGHNFTRWEKHIVNKPKYQEGFGKKDRPIYWNTSKNKRKRIALQEEYREWKSEFRQKLREKNRASGFDGSQPTMVPEVLEWEGKKYHGPFKAVVNQCTCSNGFPVVTNPAQKKYCKAKYTKRDEDTMAVAIGQEQCGTCNAGYEVDQVDRTCDLLDVDCEITPLTPWNETECVYNETKFDKDGTTMLHETNQTVTCGKGVQTRSREILNEAVGGGKECPDPSKLVEVQECEVFDCAYEIKTNTSDPPQIAGYVGLGSICDWYESLKTLTYDGELVDGEEEDVGECALFKSGATVLDANDISAIDSQCAGVPETTTSGYMYPKATNGDQEDLATTESPDAIGGGNDTNDTSSTTNNATMNVTGDEQEAELTVEEQAEDGEESNENLPEGGEDEDTSELQVSEGSSSGGVDGNKDGANDPPSAEVDQDSDEETNPNSVFAHAYDKDDHEEHLSSALLKKKARASTSSSAASSPTTSTSERAKLKEMISIAKRQLGNKKQQKSTSSSPRRHLQNTKYEVLKKNYFGNPFATPMTVTADGQDHSVSSRRSSSPAWGSNPPGGVVQFLQVGGKSTTNQMTGARHMATMSQTQLRFVLRHLAERSGNSKQVASRQPTGTTTAAPQQKYYNPHSQKLLARKQMSKKDILEDILAGPEISDEEETNFTELNTTVSLAYQITEFRRKFCEAYCNTDELCRYYSYSLAYDQCRFYSECGRVTQAAIYGGAGEKMSNDMIDQTVLVYSDVFEKLP
ncbi:unnamed protein product [Amoebophrya sp. A120]|nr:unnamed protein product [Amoebophrya sp. A120]|eukprot:GSA120T00019331001.1